MERIHSLEHGAYLNERIKAGLIEIHQLQNQLHPILPKPELVAPEVGPQVIVTEDDGENAGGPTPAPTPSFVENDGKDEEIEVEPSSDLEDGMLFNVDDV